ncbi:hypothetical protein HanIR_Chr05g0219971 [Helianthus annuus]|nr:hypothetical protein HanIR_Chr05g0219971 [Helianthus annuus]
MYIMYLVHVGINTKLYTFTKITKIYMCTWKTKLQNKMSILGHKHTNGQIRTLWTIWTL